MHVIFTVRPVPVPEFSVSENVPPLALVLWHPTQVQAGRCSSVTPASASSSPKSLQLFSYKISAAKYNDKEISQGLQMTTPGRLYIWDADENRTVRPDSDVVIQLSLENRRGKEVDLPGKIVVSVLWQAMTVMTEESRCVRSSKRPESAARLYSQDSHKKERGWQ